MAKSTKKAAAKKAPAKKAAVKKAAGKKAAARKATPVAVLAPIAPPPPRAIGTSSAVLDRLWNVIESRRSADPDVSHSARLLSRGTAKVAQKFGEEAVECLIEATLGNPEGVVAESADVLYHLLVLWVDAGIRPEDVWGELLRREGVSGIAEKASRAKSLPGQLGLETSKIP
ncbi:MAG: phosphoribosyl-ATP diphosphatase [Alphaproteobacteria bacterium]|nr:phosphoribosyl-ATP diphosphatase [Alphaproteobacteria bacterium]